MEDAFLEVKSALWQKIFISLLFLFFITISIGCWISPFVTIFAPPAPTLPQALSLGTVFFLFGLSIWWPVIRYSIRAGHHGIVQTNGYFRQSVLWSEVAYYYVEPNQRFHAERRLHVEPVMFNSNGEIVFRGFAHLLVSTRKIISERQKLWQFVESQLQGKRVDAPSPDLNPEVLALRTLEVVWSKKNVLWKVGRLVGLVCYALFWLAVSLVPLYYVLVNNITVPKLWVALIVLPMCIGPLLPHMIWLEVKKRKIAKEMQRRKSIDCK